MLGYLDIYAAEAKAKAAKDVKSTTKATAAAAANTKPCTESAPVAPTRHEIPVGILEGEEALISMSYKDLKWAKRWADNWEWETYLKPMLQFAARASKRLHADLLWQEQGYDAFIETIHKMVAEAITPLVEEYKSKLEGIGVCYQSDGRLNHSYVVRADGYYSLKQSFITKVEGLAEGVRAAKNQVPKAKCLHKILEGAAKHLENCAPSKWRLVESRMGITIQKGYISKKKESDLISEARSYGMDPESFLIYGQGDKGRQAGLFLLKAAVEKKRKEYLNKDSKPQYSMADALKKAGLC